MVSLQTRQAGFFPLNGMWNKFIRLEGVSQTSLLLLSLNLILQRRFYGESVIILLRTWTLQLTTTSYYPPLLLHSLPVVFGQGGFSRGI